MNAKKSKTLTLTFFLFSLMILNIIIIIPVASISASSTKVSQTNEAAIARISNIRIEYVSTMQINLSFQYDVYNPNSANMIYFSQNSCGFELGVSIINPEGQAGLNFVENSCSNENPTTITFKPGLSHQIVNNASIFLSNLPQDNINDLPIADYKLVINYNNFNLTSYGANILYNGTGQFYITYDQNSYSFWDNPAIDYTTLVSNSFIRTNFAFSMSTVSPIFPSIEMTIVLIILITILGIIYFVLKKKAKNNNNFSTNDLNSNKNSSAQQGTFNKVLLDKLCPVCGNKVANSDLFCPNCGNRV